MSNRPSASSFVDPLPTTGRLQPAVPFNVDHQSWATKRKWPQELTGDQPQLLPGRGLQPSVDGAVHKQQQQQHVHPLQLPPLSSLSLTSGSSSLASVEALVLPPLRTATTGREPLQPQVAVAPPIPYFPTSFSLKSSTSGPLPSGILALHQTSLSSGSSMKQLPLMPLNGDSTLPSSFHPSKESQALSSPPGAVPIMGAAPGHVEPGARDGWDQRKKTRHSSALPTLEKLLQRVHGRGTGYRDDDAVVDYPSYDSLMPPGWDTSSSKVLAQRERLLRAAMESAAAAAAAGAKTSSHPPTNDSTDRHQQSSAGGRDQPVPADPDDGTKEDSAEGYREGFMDGYKEGRKEGFEGTHRFKEAYRDGFKDGRAGGYIDGKQEGYRGGRIDGALASSLEEDEWEIDQYGNNMIGTNNGWAPPYLQSLHEQVPPTVAHQNGAVHHRHHHRHTPTRDGVVVGSSDLLASKPRLPPVTATTTTTSAKSDGIGNNSAPVANAAGCDSQSSLSSVGGVDGEHRQQQQHRAAHHHHHQHHHHHRHSHRHYHLDRSEPGDMSSKRTRDRGFEGKTLDEGGRLNSGRNSNGRHPFSDLRQTNRLASYSSAREEDEADRNPCGRTGSDSREEKDLSESFEESARPADDTGKGVESACSDNSRKRKRHSHKDRDEPAEKRRSTSSSSSGKSASPPESGDGEKKRKRATREQLDILERVFEQEELPSRNRRKELANELGFSPRRIQIWFQNRRAKSKKKEGKQYVMVNYGKHSFKKEPRRGSPARSGDE